MPRGRKKGSKNKPQESTVQANSEAQVMETLPIEAPETPIETSQEPVVEKQPTLSQELTSPEKEVKQQPKESLEDIKPVIEIEEFRPEGQLDAKFLNPSLDKIYKLHYCKKSILGSNRKGIWHVVDKRAHHFSPANLQVTVDHTPDKSYYSVDELVLCVARQETVTNRNRSIQERTNQSIAAIKETYRQDAARAVGDAGTKRSPTFGDIKVSSGRMSGASFN